MEPSSLLSGSDNLFKYLFTVGAVMIVLSILYPLQKGQEIELQKADLLKESELLNNEILILKKEYEDGFKEYEQISLTLDSLVGVFGEQAAKNERFVALRIRGNELIRLLADKERDLDIKNIIIKNEKSKVELLETHSKSYLSYYKFIKGIGIFFLFIGFFGWCFSTFVREKTSWVNLQKESAGKSLYLESRSVSTNKTQESKEEETKHTSEEE